MEHSIKMSQLKVNKIEKDLILKADIIQTNFLIMASEFKTRIQELKGLENQKLHKI